MARCCRTGNAAAQLPAAALACAASAAEAFDPMLITGLATTLGHMGLFFWGIVVTMVLLFGCLACMMWDAGSDAHKLNKKRKAKSALAKKGWFTGGSAETADKQV